MEPCLESSKSAPAAPFGGLPLVPGERAIVESMGEAVIATDHQYRITYWNPAATATYGWTAAEVLGQPVAALLATTWTSPDEQRAAFAAVAHGERWRGEVTQVRKDGQRVWILSVVTVLRDAEGVALGLVAVNRDLTAQRQAEKALAQAEIRLADVQRLDALGELAGSVAHDFNNLLAIVGGRAEIAADLLPPEHPAVAALTQIRASVARGASLTRQLLSFGRRDVLDATNVDLVDLVQGIDEVLRRILGARHRLELQLSPVPVWVRVSRGELEQVLINLCSNSRDAMSVSGRVRISVTSPAPGVAELAVVDNGSGMTDEVRARAFDAFFTTKPAGKGTGLGLALVARVVARHGGTVAIDSAPGTGTRVALQFPRLAAGEVAPAPRPAGATPRLRVLLAEDQELVRDVLTELLRLLDHEVLAVSDGQAAVELAARERVDLLLTDVSMPGLSGPAAAAAIRVRRPDLPVIYLSGFPKDEASIAAGLWPAGIFRLKPITRDGLAQAIAEAVAPNVARSP